MSPQVMAAVDALGQAAEALRLIAQAELNVTGNRLLTPKQAAKEANVSVMVIARAYLGGALPAVRLTRDCVRIKHSALRAWIDSREER